MALFSRWCKMTISTNREERWRSTQFASRQNCQTFRRLVLGFIEAGLGKYVLNTRREAHAADIRVAELAELNAGLTADLEQTRGALRLREAELAAAPPAEDLETLRAELDASRELEALKEARYAESLRR